MLSNGTRWITEQCKRNIRCRLSFCPLPSSPRAVRAGAEHSDSASRRYLIVHRCRRIPGSGRIRTDSPLSLRRIDELHLILYFLYLCLSRRATTGTISVDADAIGGHRAGGGACDWRTCNHRAAAAAVRQSAPEPNEAERAVARNDQRRGVARTERQEHRQPRNRWQRKRREKPRHHPRHHRLR